MKKVLMAIAGVAVSAAALAAFDVTAFSSADVLAPTSVSAGSTNTTVGAFVLGAK